MKEMFERFELGELSLANRFIFPPIKTAYGTPKGNVTDRHLVYYRQIAENGPGMLILEPVAVTADGKEHPKQLCIHLPESADELKKIVAVIHQQKRLACLHLNHAGAAANPKATGEKLILEPFQTVVLASGMRSAPVPDAAIGEAVPKVETIGDARNVMDIYAAVHAGYDLALKY